MGEPNNIDFVPSSLCLIKVLSCKYPVAIARANIMLVDKQQANLVEYLPTLSHLVLVVW